MTSPGEGSDTVELMGLVATRTVGAGSRSEMRAVVLIPEPGEDGSVEAVVLRRREAAALDAEPELLAYVGARVLVTGTRSWTTVVVDSVEVLDPPAPPARAADDL